METTIQHNEEISLTGSTFELKPVHRYLTAEPAQSSQGRFELGYGRCTMCSSCQGFTGSWETCQTCEHPFDRHL
jgi:hypothetical protein